MKGQIIGRRAYVVERHELDAEPAGDVGRDERIVRDDAHAERARAAGDFLTDTSQPGDGECLAAELAAEKPALFPAFVLHRAIRGRNRPRHGQHERQRVLGDADAVGAGRIDDEDAACGRGIDVDVVDARAGARDDAKPRGSSD